MDGCVEGFRIVTGLRNCLNGNKDFCCLHLPNGDYQWM